MKNKKLLKVLFIALALVTAGVIFTFVKGSDNTAGEITQSSEEDASDAVSQETETCEAEEAQTEEETVCVHVCGAVNDPGVYYLEAGSRVHEAVEMAGGLSSDAAEEYVNLAQVITDGEQIYIPTLEEAQEQGLEIGSSSSSDEDESGLININTATSEELQSLSGIGQAKAEAIIAYREDNGDFTSIEDITNVSGIGESTYEKIKDQITV